MFGLGTIVNTIAVVVGGIIGLLFKNGLKNRYQETIMQGIGLAVLFVGISGAMTGMLKISKSIIESTGSLILGRHFSLLHHNCKLVTFHNHSYYHQKQSYLPFSYEVFQRSF